MQPMSPFDPEVQPFYEAYHLLATAINDPANQIGFRAQHFAEGAPWTADTIPVKRSDLQLEDGYPGERFFDAASEALIEWERENTPD